MNLRPVHQSHTKILGLVKPLEFKYRHPASEGVLRQADLRRWRKKLFKLDPPTLDTGLPAGKAIVDMSESIFKGTIQQIARIIEESGVSSICSCIPRALEFATSQMNVIEVAKFQIENLVNQPRHSPLNKVVSAEIHHIIWMTFYTTFHLAKFHFIGEYDRLSRKCWEIGTCCSLISQPVSDFIASSVNHISSSRFFLSAMSPPRFPPRTLELIAGNSCSFRCLIKGSPICGDCKISTSAKRLLGLSPELGLILCSVICISVFFLTF